MLATMSNKSELDKYIVNHKFIIMKLQDTTTIFTNFNEALMFVLDKEQEAFTADLQRQRQPVIVAPRDPTRPPLKLFPGVSFWNDADETDYILTRLNSGRYNLKPNLHHRKFLFRGQTAFYDQCTPNLFRVNKSRYTADLIHGQEMMLLTLSHPLVRLLDYGVNLLGYNFTFEMNLYGLNQHYYNKTCLLDLTSDINVAGFFATNKYDSKTDTYTPMTDVDQLGVLYYYNIGSNDDFVYQGLSAIGLQVFPRSGRQSGFLQRLDKGMNFNDRPQVKWVFFKHDAHVSEYYSQLFHQGVDLFPHDILEQHWKARNPNIVSDRTVILNMIMNEHKESKSQIMKELSSRGLSVRKYIPMFTPKELHEYYQDIKNGFWEHWCSRIHFSGDKNDTFKNALTAVVNNPQYAWAFVEGQNIQMPFEGFLSSRYRDCLVLR